jgi:hypothetical protein
VKQAVMQQQVEAIEADEAQQEKIMERLRQIGRCPAGACAGSFCVSSCACCDAMPGLVWYQVEGGWRCEGGGHFVTDEQLNYTDDEGY